MPYDWRPPRDQDWTRLRALLRFTMIRSRILANAWDEAERDVRAIGGESWSIGIGRYSEHAKMEREVADMLEDELRALEGGHTRKIALDDRGMFPGTLAP